MTLYYASASGIWPEEWIPLGGEVESCDLFTADDPSADALPLLDQRKWCTSVSFPIKSFSARGYWILTRRPHLRVAVAHRAYRRKTRNRW